MRTAVIASTCSRSPRHRGGADPRAGLAHPRRPGIGAGLPGAARARRGDAVAGRGCGGGRGRGREPGGDDAPVSPAETPAQLGCEVRQGDLVRESAGRRAPRAGDARTGAGMRAPDGVLGCGGPPPRPWLRRPGSGSLCSFSAWGVSCGSCSCAIMTPWVEWAEARSPTGRGRRSSRCCRRWCSAAGAGEMPPASWEVSPPPGPQRDPLEAAYRRTWRDLLERYGLWRTAHERLASGARTAPGSGSGPRSSSRTTASTVSAWGAPAEG